MESLLVTQPLIKGLAANPPVKLHPCVQTVGTGDIWGA